MTIEEKHGDLSECIGTTGRCISGYSLLGIGRDPFLSSLYCLGQSPNAHCAHLLGHNYAQFLEREISVVEYRQVVGFGSRDVLRHSFTFHENLSCTKIVAIEYLTSVGWKQGLEHPSATPVPHGRSIPRQILLQFVEDAEVCLSRRDLSLRSRLLQTTGPSTVLLSSRLSVW